MKLLTAIILLLITSASFAQKPIWWIEQHNDTMWVASGTYLKTTKKVKDIAFVEVGGERLAATNKKMSKYKSASPETIKYMALDTLPAVFNQTAGYVNIGKGSPLKSSVFAYVRGDTVEVKNVRIIKYVKVLGEIHRIANEPEVPGLKMKRRGK